MGDLQRCTKCILPINYPDIHFDEDGVCSFCLADPNQKSISRKNAKGDLDKIINAYKGKSSKYDVVVGLSGGKDSSYVAHYLRKEYGLKLLGVNYDIGYRSKYAIQNLETLVDKLNVDLLTIRPNKNFLMKLFAHFLRKRGQFCPVCSTLVYLTVASFSWNQKQSLGFSPLMVGGWSKEYEFQQGVSVLSIQFFFENLTQELFEELLAQPFIEESVVLGSMKLKDARQAQVGTEENMKLGDYAMNLVMLPDYIDWNIREMPYVLAEELGWEHPPDVHESHFDCLLFPLKEYLKYKKYGFTQETIKNSVLIRQGLMTREEAFERMSLEQMAEPEILEGFFDDLGITKDDVDWQAEWSR